VKVVPDVAALIRATKLNMTSHSRGAMRPEFCISFALSEDRGRGEDRVRAAPAVSHAIAQNKAAHEHTGSAETLRPPPRNGFTAYFELALVTGFLATIISRGFRFHTTSPYAFATLVSRSISVHRIPPHGRDDRDRPSIG
jgi:hypothetical protein